MTDSALLIHVSSADAAALVDAMQRRTVEGSNAFAVDIERLLDIFCSKINSFTSAYVSIEDEPLRAALLPRMPGAKDLGVMPEISAVRAIFADKVRTQIAIANGIYPLLDVAVTGKLFAIHTEYRADISYAENLPAGMALTFVSRDLLESLDIMEAKDNDITTGIRGFVEKNINQFHAEVHYEEPDLRLLRLDFSLATKRSIVKADAFLEKLLALKEKNALQNPYAQLPLLIADAPGLLHSFPSYIEIEFSATATAPSYFSPLAVIQQPPATISRVNLTKVRDYIATGLGDTSVSVGGLGEPLEHPEAISFLTELLEDTNIRYVFLETNGLHLDKVRSLARHPAVHKLRIIVLLNTLERYEELSGAPKAALQGVQNSVRNLAADLSAAGKNSTEILYLQALKVEENETEIDALYALAEELGASFLLQKYNRYAGLLPERRVSDMTPLERYSCWHLRRDLFIRANGDVAFCKQTVDPSKPTARGNLSKDTLQDLWTLQREDFVRNYQGKYPAHLPCATCDEYFTFNY